MSEEALGTKASHTSVANWVQEAADEVLRWLNRPIREDIAYLVLDGLYVPIKRERSTMQPILIAMGVTETGVREVLGLLVARSENYDSWCTMLSTLRARGLQTDKLRLVVSDGYEGLIEAIERELPNAPRQRCTVHKTRNTVGRCPKHVKGIAPKEASEIWKAPNRAEARCCSWLCRTSASKVSSPQPPHSSRMSVILRTWWDGSSRGSVEGRSVAWGDPANLGFWSTRGVQGRSPAFCKCDNVVVFEK